MIQVENLHKRFGDAVAVDDVSFTIQPGEVVGFLGPNGAGKTTTMRMLTGFLRPDQGRVRIFAEDMQRTPRRAKTRLGYLPEGAPAYGEMTPRAFLDFIARVRGYRGPEKRRRIERVVTLLELAHVLERPVEKLSKGFKRRVGLAQAILHQPPALILDEPTDGLDPNQKHRVRELIHRLAEDSLIIISTHILEEVATVCNRALIISRGHIVADSTPAELERRSRYHGAITLRLPSPEVAPELALLPGVAHVEADRSIAGRYTLIPEAGVELYPALQTWLTERRIEIGELVIERGRLDEVFRRLTTEEAA
ncbi:MAG: ABC transporter ATP-binding protein [Methylohalobius sp. ZOD2]